MAHSDVRNGQANAADAARIQRFLEEAAPVILESRTLDDQRLDQVLALARRHAVNEAELWRELRWLARRGVITDAPWQRLSPPPAPAPAKGPPEGKSTEAGERPPPLPEQAAPPKPAAPPPRSEPQPVRPPEPPAPERVQPGSAAAPGTEDPPSTAPPAPPESPAAEAPAAPAPMDAFAAWVERKLANYKSALLAVDDENGLIGVGVHRFHLAEVLARHIVREIATRADRRLERDLQGASEHSTVGSATLSAEDQDKLQLFFDRVAPILTLHRGINTQSRILMSAVAQQMGLTEEQFDQAVAQLQQSATGSSGEDPQQAERIESYRRYLRRAIAQLSGGIIPFGTLQRLQEAGEYFHGVDRERIVPTIREVASETGAQFISKQQAIDHVADLIDDVWQRGASVTGDTRVRIYAEGTQWGLDPRDVESVLREQTRQRRAAAAQQRRQARRMILLTAATLLIVLGFLGYLIRPDLRGDSAASRTATPPEPTAPKPVQRDEDAWIDADLRIAMAQARSWLPDKRELIEAILEPLPSARGTAYEQLAEDALAATDDPMVREMLQPLLIQLFAREPSDATANQLATMLLRDVSGLDERLPERPERIDSLFWAVRTAVRMWLAPELAQPRADKLAARVEAAIGQPLDRLTDAEALQRTCLTALAKRLYERLTAQAGEQPDRVDAMAPALMRVSAECVDPQVLDPLDATLLAAVLPAAGEDWYHYDRVLERLVSSPNPNVVVQMLHLLEDTTDPQLQSYLAALLAERIGTSDAMTVEQLVAEVRLELGIPDLRELTRRWTQLAQRARKALDDAPVEGTRSDVLLEKSLDLTFLATEACALSQGMTGQVAYDALEAEGPPKLEAGAGPWRTPSEAPLVSDVRENAPAYIEKYIADLVRVQNVSARLRLLNMVAKSADTVGDVSLQSGQALGEYMTTRKGNEQERSRILEIAPKLARWNAVRIGLADQLTRKLAGDAHALELFATVYGDELDVADDAERLALRRRSLEQAVDELGTSTPTTAAEQQLATQATAGMTKLLSKQASLLSIPSDQYASAERPSGVLVPLIKRIASELDRGAVDGPSRLLLDRLPHRLRAVRFLAENDLQHTVYLQQLLARLLAQRVTKLRPESGPQAQQSILRMDQMGLQSTHILEQLWHVHAALLELWLLHQPAPEEGGPAGG